MRFTANQLPSVCEVLVLIPHYPEKRGRKGRKEGKGDKRGDSREGRKTNKLSSSLRRNSSYSSLSPESIQA